MDVSAVEQDEQTFDVRRLAGLLEAVDEEFSAEQVERLTRYGELLHARNKVTNLTAGA
jgi:16S rRNA G527 N7-methylase RsmG